MTHSVQVLIGPTASGKTAYALTLAAQQDLVIINMDAMQMYADLRIITARPTPEEEAQAEHRLYGVLEATVHGNAALWCELAAQEIQRAGELGKHPLLVGGTGMYLKCLMEGLPKIPAISEAVKAQVAAMDNLHESLQAYDPAMAQQLEPGDFQRIQRALEVKLETGRSLSEWHDDPVTPFFPDAGYDITALLPPREEVYAKINARFAQMAENGAIEEVRELRSRMTGGLDSQISGHPSIRPSVYPLLKAHGVPEILAYLEGTMYLEEAISKAQQNTRNYAKRQMTWIRNQLPEAKRVEH